MSRPLLADHLDPDHNSLTLVRLGLAVLVVISHSFVLATGNRVADPFTAWTGYSLGDHAVNVFFVLSGIVTTASLLRLGSPARFLVARALRVVPAVAIFAVLFALAAAPWVTTKPLAEYFSSRDVMVYILRTASFAPGHPLLPGVFETNPMAAITNEPLWTVKYEIFCYLALALAGLIVLRRGRRTEDAARWLGLGAAVIAIGHVVTTALVPIALPETAGHLRRFLFCFALGILAFVLAGRIRLDWRWLAALGLLYAATYATPLRPAVSVVLTGYAALLAATSAFGPLRAITNRYDLSYGTYVFGWPVAQMLMVIVPGLSIAALTGATLALVLPLALLSWVFVERPALTLKYHFRRHGSSTRQISDAE